MTQPLTVSVVIPAKNEERRLARCLQALSQQKTSAAFEVIVVDNGSTDQTVRVARSFLKSLRLTIVREHRGGRGRARKTGFGKANGEFILSTDADTVVPPHWVQTYVDAFRTQPDVAAFTNIGRIEDCTRWKNTFLTYGSWACIRTMYGITGFTCLNGFNFGIRRSVYERSGGFDPLSDAQEDMLLTLRVRQIGKVRMLNAMPVTSGRRFEESLLKGMGEYAKTFVQSVVLGRENVTLTTLSGK